MVRVTLKNGEVKRVRFTLDMYCEMTGAYRPYLRKGWHSVEYSDFKKCIATLLNIDASEIDKAVL